MANYITLQFNDGEINLSISSFLFKQSKLCQSCDIEEDNHIPILCSRSYVLDENDTFLFDDKPDLLFMFTLQPNNFLDICKFLDIICYENININFSMHFMLYVMDSLKEEINTIRYFMQPEIRSIMNYLNNEDIDLQIKSCTPTFYVLYLNEYKEEIFKHNRIDIYECLVNKYEYYRYIHKYDNHITYNEKQTQEYKDYVIDLSNNLLLECSKENNIIEIKKTVELGANVNLQDKYGYTALHNASRRYNNLKVIKYLVEHGADINLQDKYGYTALHYASYTCYDAAIMYLVRYDANVNLQDNNGNTALHYASIRPNKLEVIKYLVEQGTNVNLQNNNGNTALHNASMQPDNLKTIEYLVEQGTNVNLQNNYGQTALHYASLQIFNNLKTIEYLVKHGVNINLQNIDGNTALHFSSHRENNLEVINYLVEHGANINLQNNNGWTALHHLFKRLYILTKKNKKITKLVQYFVEHGADINIRNNTGQTAL